MLQYTYAIAFIKRSHRERKPFFINLWIHEPHTPFHTVPKYRWRFRELEERDNIYASVLSHADDRIGEVLDALDQLQLTENTLVIFSSDNGPARAADPAELKLVHDTATGAGYGIGAARGVTGGRKGYKSALFEGGIGVPFIARWPGQIAADRIDRVSMLSAVDLLPTFCALAGATYRKTTNRTALARFQRFSVLLTRHDTSRSSGKCNPRGRFASRGPSIGSRTPLCSRTGNCSPIATLTTGNSMTSPPIHLKKQT